MEKIHGENDEEQGACRPWIPHHQDEDALDTT